MAEPGTREFLERHLVSDGFAVLGADAGREALELVERERPDLVLVGGLPDAPALEVCRVLREGEPEERVVRSFLQGIRIEKQTRQAVLRWYRLPQTSFVKLVELRGVEPLTPRLPALCSPN